MPKKTRVSIDLSNEGVRNLRDLQIRMSSASYTEIFRKAMALLDMAVSAQEEGHKLVLRKADNSEEVIRLL